MAQAERDSITRRSLISGAMALVPAAGPSEIPQSLNEARRLADDLRYEEAVVEYQRYLGDRDFRRSSYFPRFQGEALDHNLTLVAKLAELAQAKDCTPGQLALAWVLAQGDDIIPIPGTRRRARLEENLKALDVQLTAADLKQMEETFPRGIAAGQRYSEQMMKLIDAA